MRIVSKFKDYYDCIQQYGQDDLLYVRHKEVVRYEDRQYPLPKWDRYSGWNWQLPRAAAITIGFAGKVYYALEIHPDTGAVICHSPADAAAVVVKFPKRLRTIYAKRPGRVPSQWAKSPEDLVMAFFNPEKPPKCAGEFFNKAPVWVGRGDGWNGWQVTFNDCLRPLDFMRVLPPHAAFQELYAWMSNQTKPFRPVPDVDDKTLAEAKGFDRFSFRKQKQVRK